MQGVTIKRDTNVVAHGSNIMPDGLYYVMLSRSESMENMFLENFLPNKLKANKRALLENEKLLARCISPKFENLHFSYFVLNVRSLSKHFDDLKNDIYAQQSSHICVVETWIDPTTADYDYEFDDPFEISGRSFDHASVGRGKGCAIFSDTSRSYSNGVKVIKENFQMMSIVDANVQFILVYLSSNCDLLDVVQELQRMLRPDLVTIISGDFNFDKNEKNHLSHFLEAKQFQQLVQCPTHDPTVTTTARTIDHCYVPRNIHDKFHITFHSPYFTDHDALCINFENKF